MEQTTANLKQDMRAQLKSARRQWLASQSAHKNHWDLEICKQLAQVLESLRSKKHEEESRGAEDFQSSQGSELTYVALYRAQPWEVNPHLVLPMAKGWRWAYPRVDGRQLSFYSPNSVEAFEEGSFGIEEPILSQAQRISLDSCVALVAPALGFDRRGQRLGSGQGFYDRSLQGFAGLKIGLAYSVQIYTGDFPVEEHDIPMDVVITEQAVLNNKFDGLRIQPSEEG